MKGGKNKRIIIRLGESQYSLFYKYVKEQYGEKGTISEAIRELIQDAIKLETPKIHIVEPRYSEVDLSILRGTESDIKLVKKCILQWQEKFTTLFETHESLSVETSTSLLQSLDSVHEVMDSVLNRISKI